VTALIPYLEGLALLTVTLPCLACLALGGWVLIVGSPPERATAGLVAATFTTALLCAVALTLGMAGLGVQQFDLSLGTWFEVGDYGFELDLLVDRLTAPFMVLTTALLGLVGRFSFRYLHREPGFTRFFFLLLMFAVGMLLLTMAGSIDVLFAGWELVGITSALLIGFFQERRGPVDNALWTFAVYRVCDVGLLAAAILLHHGAHTGLFGVAFAPNAWPAGEAHLEGDVATILALLLVFAALGKSAQVPFSGWLPRAMEGPTPSSAIFYGALSIHAGAYLLLRAGPLLAASPLASGVLVAVGGISALHGTLVGRVQSDIKSQLAYASVTQVGLILAEIGLGLRWIPLAHLIGHACLRTLQLLRAPSLLHDHHQLVARFGEAGLPAAGVYYEQLFPARLRRWLYRLALERGHLDVALIRFVVQPTLALASLLDSGESAVARLFEPRPAPTSEREDHSQRHLHDSSDETQPIPAEVPA
jgi:NADH-quinone oxidoreductase subunit L